ncbi:MAG: hypothetical protein LBH08_01965 [Puniceicoccales bacterium]|nr:hypothetical protein [Puniceicoccales bacterium]
MKISKKAIVTSFLFSLLGMTNCVASNDPIVQQMVDMREHFNAMKGLYEQNTISLLEFAKAVICVFQDQATEERGLVNILCEQCGISNDVIRTELIVYCLRNPCLKNVPILRVNIPEISVNTVCASNDLCANPHPEFYQAVMAANSLEEVIEVFNRFFDEFDASFEANPKVIAQQAEIYAKATILKIDIPRGFLTLMIGEKTVSITKESFTEESKNIQGIFRVILDHLQKPEEDGGAELDAESAFHILKQIALAYRGQNGTVDGHYLINMPLIDISNVGLLLKFSGVAITMKFENCDGYFNLVEKTEYSPIWGLINILHNRNVTSELQFKFPGDSKIRTNLPVTSTRKFSVNETIEWDCLLRESPPKEIIFYGGCDSSDTH